MDAWMLVVVVLIIVVAVAALYDLFQREHTIRRNFPLLGRIRYWLEAVGPELRQYIVTSNDEERPFSRDQRRWIYSSAKRQNNYFSFGTDNDLESSPGHVVIKQAPFPAAEPGPGQVGGLPLHLVPCAKVIGAWTGREHAYRPSSVVYVSGMSYGALSASAVEALNRGCALADCLHDTGEGGLTSYHQLGADLIFQIGTGYFGVRDEKGRFDLDRLVEHCSANPVKAIEIKLSQGAKPGHGGVLPAAKVTPELARFRGVRLGEDCISPPGHTEFCDEDSLIEFVERIASATGRPVGIKCAVGDDGFFDRLAGKMAATGAGPDFITIDGGEGGTGAAPLVFADHVSLPFKIGFSRVYRAFARHDMHEHVTFAGSGRLGFPDQALFAFALGCDMIGIAREALISIGCIQAQKCHTNHCPTGVATQSKWLMRGLDPTNKAARLANYVVTLRKELLELSRVCGQAHPAFVDPDSIEVLDEHFGSRRVREIFGYEPGWGRPSDEDLAALREVLGTPNLEPDRIGTVRRDTVDNRGSIAAVSDADARDAAGAGGAWKGSPEPR